MSVPSNVDNSDGKRRKIKEFIITGEHEKIRKRIKNFVARSKNFDSLKEAIVKAIYGGEWNLSPEHRLLNEEEVVLDIFIMISEEAYTILSIIPMNKALPAIEHRLELKEKVSEGTRRKVKTRMRGLEVSLEEDCMKFGVYDVDSEECRKCGLYDLCKYIVSYRRQIIE